MTIGSQGCRRSVSERGVAADVSCITRAVAGRTPGQGRGNGSQAQASSRHDFGFDHEIQHIEGRGSSCLRRCSFEAFHTRHSAFTLRMGEIHRCDSRICTRLPLTASAIADARGATSGLGAHAASNSMLIAPKRRAGQCVTMLNSFVFSAAQDLIGRLLPEGPRGCAPRNPPRCPRLVPTH